MRHAAWTLLLGAALLSPSGPLGAEDAPAGTPQAARILFLHHSTGACIWNGGVPAWIERYNRDHGTHHTIVEQAFPKDAPYGWENYPYDYWRIWVSHAGPRPYRGEPTLEILTSRYDVIVFKHCFPVSAVESDIGEPDVTSPDKRLENYRLQYGALKQKLRSFPKTRFLVWTASALTEAETDDSSARRARAFVDWVRTRWDEKGDNIFLFDFHELETEGGLYLKPEYAEGPNDSHPNAAFSQRVAPLFAQRVIDVAEGRGDATPASPPPPTGPAPAPAETPTPPVEPGADGWTLDDAEDPTRSAALWGPQASVVEQGDGHVLRLHFQKGRSEDWGEYGPHRVIETHAAPADQDLSAFRYLALRVRSDRTVLVPLALVRRERKANDPAHYAFTAYLHLAPGPARWLVYDLSTLELGVEGPAFHAAEGSPERPRALTSLRLAIDAAHADAEIELDETQFLRTLPASLAPYLQQP